MILTMWVEICILLIQDGSAIWSNFCAKLEVKRWETFCLAKLLFKFHLLQRLKPSAWTYLLTQKYWWFSGLSAPKYFAGADLAAHTEHHPVSERVFVECLWSVEILMICMPISHGEHHYPPEDKLRWKKGLVTHCLLCLEV